MYQKKNPIKEHRIPLSFLLVCFAPPLPNGFLHGRRRRNHRPLPLLPVDCDGREANHPRAGLRPRRVHQLPVPPTPPRRGPVEAALLSQGASAPATKLQSLILLSSLFRKLQCSFEQKMFLWITLLVEPSALFSTRGDLDNPIHFTFSKAWGWLSHTNSPKYSHWVFFSLRLWSQRWLIL
jgi:hypothetical protein